MFFTVCWFGVAVGQEWIAVSSDEKLISLLNLSEFSQMGVSSRLICSQYNSPNHTRIQLTTSRVKLNEWWCFSFKMTFFSNYIRVSLWFFFFAHDCASSCLNCSWCRATNPFMDCNSVCSAAWSGQVEFECSCHCWATDNTQVQRQLMETTGSRD